MLVLQIIYGAIPLGDPLSCATHDSLAFALFVNPFTHVVYAFCDFTIGFAVIDLELPWRPLRYYVGWLGVIYAAQVILMLPLALTNSRTVPT